MNETETRAEHIDPALAAAGWGVVEGSRIRREYAITQGRLEGFGRRGKSLTADYVLIYPPGQSSIATLVQINWRLQEQSPQFTDMMSVDSTNKNFLVTSRSWQLTASLLLVGNGSDLKKAMTMEGC